MSNPKDLESKIFPLSDVPDSLELPIKKFREPLLGRELQPIGQPSRPTFSSESASRDVALAGSDGDALPLCLLLSLYTGDRAPRGTADLSDHPILLVFRQVFHQ